MPNFESYCRCPGCGECNAHANEKKLKARLAEARWLLLAYREDGYPLNYDEWRKRRAAFLRIANKEMYDRT